MVPEPLAQKLLPTLPHHQHTTIRLSPPRHRSMSFPSETAHLCLTLQGTPVYPPLSIPDPQVAGDSLHPWHRDTRPYQMVPS